MDACGAVEKEIDKVLTKFDDIRRNSSTTIDDLLNHVNNIRREIEDGGTSGTINPGQAILLSQTVKRIQDSLGHVSADHKDLHGNVSKVGKAIDRNFVSDFNSVCNETAFAKEEQTSEINQVICEHFLRQGMLDIAESLVEESGLEIHDQQIEPFLELHRILEALKQHNLSPALHWAQAHRNELTHHRSSLEFKLLRLNFIDLVSQGVAKQQEALHFARNFAPFASSHTKELQVLMGTLLYLRQGLDSSPYRHLLDPIHWVDICDVFTREACTLLGLSMESALSVIVKAGCAALPPLLTIKQVMLQRQCSGVWSAKDELPVEIDIGVDCRFHSIFACPILKQQSNDSNPPVRLICGHVISRDALQKLANGNKVKCPYCPVEQAPSDARQIFF
ncbi:hypothetical protein CAPTEDRAFT_159757, partial [Capitella teleta]